jgi:hypothetical protein
MNACNNRRCILLAPFWVSYCSKEKFSEANWDALTNSTSGFPPRPQAPSKQNYPKSLDAACLPADSSLGRE